MLLKLILGHGAYQVLESIVVAAFPLPKWPDERCLVPPPLQELEAPIRIPEEEHTYRTKCKFY
jgi:hypothetical protein